MSDSPRAPHRIVGYLGMLGLFGTGLASAVAVGRAHDRSMPESFSVQDLLVGAAATHKFTRLIAKDGVTTPLRAPFTEFEENAGSGEVNESPKESHLQHVPGEILTCPFCLAPWVATAYVAGLVLAPRVARAWAATFGIVATSDWLQHVYTRLQAD